MQRDTTRRSDWRLATRRDVVRSLRAAAVLAACDARVSLAAATTSVGTPEPPPPLTLFGWFGFDADDRRRVAAGDIVARALPSRRAQQMRVATALMLPQPLESVRRGLSDSGFYPPDPDLIATGAFDAAAGAWAGLAFTAAERREAERIRDPAPGSTVNLSAAEITTLHNRLAGVQETDLSAVSAAFHAVLSGRCEAYAARGIAGIAPYDRGGGREQRPDQALRAETDDFDAQFAPSLAVSRLALAAYPRPADHAVHSRLSWRKTLIDGRVGVQLLHLMTTGGAGWHSAVTRQFYVSHSYDCLQAIAVFYAAGEATLLIDHNATTTDQIPPVFGALARALGGGALRQTLERHFAALQAGLRRAP